MLSRIGDIYFRGGERRRYGVFGIAVVVVVIVNSLE